MTTARTAAPAAGTRTGARVLARDPARLYLAVAGVVLVAYGLLAAFFIANPGFPATGPADLAHAVDSGEPPASVARAAADAKGTMTDHDLVAALDPTAPGGALWIVYALKANGSVYDAVAIDARRFVEVTDAARIKPTGAWQYIGLVKSPTDWVVGGVALLGLTLVIWKWAKLALVRARLASRTPLTGIRGVLGQPVTVIIASATVIGLPLLWFAPGWNAWRRWQWQYRWVAGFASIMGFFFAGTAIGSGDAASMLAVGTIAAGSAALWAIGWTRVRPLGAALLARAGGTGSGPAGQSAGGGAGAGAQVGPSGGAGSPVLADPPAPAFSLVGPGACPTFADMGGMEDVKRQLRESVGLLLAFPDEASTLKVAFNGILLHGPPGTGKTMFAKATAGEFGLNFISVGSADLVSSFRGQSARQVGDAFAFARTHPPAVLFFDEIDAVGHRRDDSPIADDRQVVAALLRGMESVRDRTDVIVMAATNDVDSLDEALVRPGRFDRKIRIDLPDLPARKAVFDAQLKGRPTAADVDTAALAAATEGLSAAAIAAIVNRSALDVLRDVSAGSPDRVIDQAELLASVKAGGGTDRPLVRDGAWDDLVLPEPVKAELQELARLIEQPDLAKRFGIDPPRGALLYGPPGTGKTTIARVIAAQAHCSFYPMTGSDLISKWLGESEQNVAQLFQRARENQPSIVFLDEIDAIAPRRGERWSGATDRMLNQLLEEIDGLASTPGVFVLGATNRREMLDEALLRGGRLGRQVDIPLPDRPGREALLRLFTTRMTLDPTVSLPDIAARTDGRSGADLQALCQQAGIEALMRLGDASTSSIVTKTDFEAALAKLSRENA